MRVTSLDRARACAFGPGGGGRDERVEAMGGGREEGGGVGDGRGGGSRLLAKGPLPEGVVQVLLHHPFCTHSRSFMIRVLLAVQYVIIHNSLAYPVSG